MSLESISYADPADIDITSEIIELVDEQYKRVKPGLKRFISDFRRYEGVDMFGEDVRSEGAFISCLLYTSPSPRDPD